MGDPFCHDEFVSLAEKDIQKKVLIHIENNNYSAAFSATKEILIINRKSAFGNYYTALILYEQKKYILALDRLRYLLINMENKLTESGRFLTKQLISLCYYQMGENRKAAQGFLQTSQAATNLLDQARWYSNYLFMSSYFPEVTDQELVQRHFSYGRMFSAIKRYSHEPRLAGKLRIGYISPDFRNHVVVYFSYQLLAKYNRDKFWVSCYARGAEDAVTEQLKNLVDDWNDISCLSDEDTAALIYKNKIDILVDLSGHSANNCLPILALKPAPVQISGIGYFNTTGLPAVDYFLTDIYCDPKGKNDSDFCERLIRLPHSHFCYTPPDTIMNCKRKHKPVKEIVFGSFNNFAKITDQMLVLWLNILLQVKHSKLVLKSPHFDKEYDQKYIYQRALKLGFSSSQIEIRSATINYLEEYNDIDIALDTYPYPGGGTTCEALFMGVPVVTLYGNRHGSRFGYSLLKNLGIEGLAANTPEKYVEIAVALAKDKELLGSLHNKLPELFRASPLMDGISYVKDVEYEYEKIWDNELQLQKNR